MKSLNKLELLEINTLKQLLKENGIFKIESYLSSRSSKKFKKRSFGLS